MVMKTKEEFKKYIINSSDKLKKLYKESNQDSEMILDLMYLNYKMGYIESFNNINDFMGNEMIK